MAKSVHTLRVGQKVASIIGPRKIGTIYRTKESYNGRDYWRVYKVERMIVEWDPEINDVTYVFGVRLQTPGCGCYGDETPAIEWIGAPWNWINDRVIAEPNFADGSERVNVYYHTRNYGGAEEGGWWFSHYSPEKSIRIPRGMDQESPEFAEFLGKIEAEYGITNRTRNGDRQYVIFIEPHPISSGESLYPHHWC